MVCVGMYHRYTPSDRCPQIANKLPYAQLVQILLSLSTAGAQSSDLQIVQA